MRYYVYKIENESFETERGALVSGMEMPVKRWTRLTAIAIWAFLCMLAVFGTAERTAYGERLPLDVKVETGFGGKAKEGAWVPVKVTVTNPGDPISGELTIRMTGDSARGNDVLYARQVDLPAGSTKVVWFTLPGKQLDSSNNRVVFYEKSADKGDAVPFSQGEVWAETQLVPSYSLFVGVGARDPDTMNFLNLLAQRGYQVIVVRLSDPEFPWESAMLESFDAIALNDISSDTFNPAQIAGIRSWVSAGGQLILAGGAGYAKTAAAFGDLAPVQASGTASVETLSSLSQLAGQPLALNEPFTVSTGTVNAGETLAEENGIPILVRNDVGQGAVLYAAYDLALQPLASWAGNPSLWEHMLVVANASPIAGKNGVTRIGDMWELNSALDYFPQMVPPEYRFLALLFLLYAVLVAPAMYLVLKAVDRREWAWVAIPAFAVLTSAVIYGIGASGRGDVLAQTLSITELNGNGTAVKTSASSFFVPNGGDYEIDWEGQRNLTPFVWMGGGSRFAGKPDLIVRKGPERTVAKFENVPYWSVRKLFSARDIVQEQGKFDYSIQLDSSGLRGQVVNNTNRDLYEAGVLIGQQWIRIGDMKQGETKTFQTASANLGGVFQYDLGSLVFPYGGRDDRRDRERALLNSYIRNVHAAVPGGYVKGSQGGGILIAFAETKQSEFKIDGASVNASQIELLTQPIHIDYVQGDRFYIPSGVIVPSITDNNLTHLEYTGRNGILMVGRGDFTLEYFLPIKAGMQPEKAVFSMLPAASNFTVHIWNEKGKAWEPVTGLEFELTGAKLQEALADGRILRLKVEHTQNNGRLQLPELRVEGAVGK